MPLIPVLGRQRQEELCEFKASLVSKVSSRTARATKKDPVLKNQTGDGQISIAEFIPCMYIETMAVFFTSVM